MNWEGDLKDPGRGGATEIDERRTNALGITFGRRDAVSTELARELIDYLVRSGTYSAGDQLPSERQLAETLAVGRSAVREALKSLSLLGLVEIRQGSGTYLKATDSQLLPRVLDWGLLLGDNHLPELVEVDGYLEPAIARLAARRRTPEDITELQTLLDAVEEPGDELAMVRTVVEFHVRLATAARNEVLKNLVVNMQGLLEAWTGRVVSDGNGQYPGQAEHRAVLRAVKRGDADAAYEAMRVHISRGAGRLSTILGRPWDVVI
jgi:GntR family transcriptional regulator, transcriptional repressor for pyruvate dehydrogenase complex